MARCAEVFVRALSMAEQDAAIGDYIRWHNQRTRPKTGYATKSKIRHPDYQFNAA